MDLPALIFWFIAIVSISTLVAFVRHGWRGTVGWLGLLFLLLGLDLAGHFARKPVLIYVAAGFWFVLFLLPGLLSQLLLRYFLQQRYAAAHRLSRLICCFHPMDGWREQSRLMQALELAQRGGLAAALEIYQPFQDLNTHTARIAMCQFYRLTGRWDEFLVWYGRHRRELDSQSSFLPVLLRAKGETGDLRGLVELYHQQEPTIAKLVPASSRDNCRLVLFAFTGRRQSVEQLFTGSLHLVPADIRDFWLATADFFAGRTDIARQQLEKLLPRAAPPLRLAIERRLAQVPPPLPVLDAAMAEIIAAAEREHTHEQTFDTQRPFFSKSARATQLLVAANLLMFGLEMYRGGSTDPQALFRLGAAYAPLIFSGEWWRLFASLFLHWGPLHLAMNMFGLIALGPFVEVALGARRFLFVYLLAGLGANDIVMLLSHTGNNGQMVVGASGCIMGLIGATGALMLRGWRQEKAVVARRHLITVAVIVLVQTFFDYVTPQISMTAHLSGVVLGCLLTLPLRHHLTPPKPA